MNAIENGGSQAVEEGLEFLGRHNPNDLRAPRGSVDVTKGLTGLQQRFVPMGGGIGERQLAWIRSELQDASALSERVVVLSHLPMHPAASTPSALLWNFDEALAEFGKAGQGTVVLVMAGHFHSGGYFWDSELGIHHVTLESPLHADPEDARAHCIVEVWPDRMELLGAGIVPSRTMPLPRSRVEDLETPKLSTDVCQAPTAKF
ncbi:unnamed protein product [Polarella glacialis]|uniref:Manganese-dependent ADP-ribose/CDP-alcohol diphosphatase n=1 Tax=Polarella glacialis TaxID=89957 RepID=A0A813HNR0_POLGL|nr:unnamed protein product [Polarella glacialis]